MALEIKQLTIKSKIIYEKSTSQKAEEERKWRKRETEIINKCRDLMKRELFEQSNLR